MGLEGVGVGILRMCIFAANYGLNNSCLKQKYTLDSGR